MCQTQTLISHMSTTAQCTTWPPLWHVFHLELSNSIQPTYCTNLKIWRWKWHRRLCTQNIKLDLNNLILGNIYLIYLTILLYWLERIDSYSSFLWIYSVMSPVYAADLQYSSFMTPLGIHTSHLRPCAVTMAKYSTDLASPMTLNALMLQFCYACRCALECYTKVVTSVDESRLSKLQRNSVLCAALKVHRDCLSASAQLHLHEAMIRNRAEASLRPLFGASLPSERKSITWRQAN